MKIILTESQLEFILLNELNNTLQTNDYNPIADGCANHNPYAKKLDKSMDAVENFLHHNGIIKTNIDNGKDYLTYEINTFGELMGKRCVICQLIKDNKPFGSIYLKPYVLFKMKNTI